MIVTIFRSRLRTEYEKDYHKWVYMMESLARSMPGLISFTTFYASDGERVSIAEFETAEAHEVWRTHPKHMQAQRLGQEKFYSEFKIQVLDNPRGYSFKK
ncbi:MAG: antibiotic biosynthesis monooxygenase family protein [Thermodesulfobacteriota bacterium]